MVVFPMELPSNGKIKGVPDILNVREWDTEDLCDISKTQGGFLDSTFTQVLNKCVVKDKDTQNFSAEDLVEQDRIFVMLNMRLNILGPEYDFPFIHSVIEGGKEQCGKSIKVEIDLRKDIPITAIPDNYKSHIEIPLPSKKVVRVLLPSFRYLKESKDIVRKVQEVDMDELPVSDPNKIMFLIATHISGEGTGKKANRFESILQAIEFVKRLGSEDLAAVLKIIEYFRIWGADMMIDKECPHCKRRYRFRMPIEDQFFFDPARFSFDVQGAIRASESPGIKPV